MRRNCRHSAIATFVCALVAVDTVIADNKPEVPQQPPPHEIPITFLSNPSATWRGVLDMSTPATELTELAKECSSARSQGGWVCDRPQHGACVLTSHRLRRGSPDPVQHQGCRRCAQVFGDANPGVQDRHPHERGQTRLDLLADVGRYRRRCCRSGPTWARTGIGDSRRDARLTFGPTHFTVALPVLYLDKRRRLKVRIHGRPRSDRKRSFLLSAVAPSTSTRHPREARPINWAQRGGLASGWVNVS